MYRSERRLTSFYRSRYEYEMYEKRKGYTLIANLFSLYDVLRFIHV